MRNYFNLIELLIVIALVAVLVSLLQPALLEVQKNAKTTVCQSNLKQMGLGLYSYIEDYSGWLPISTKYGVTHRWVIEIAPYYDLNFKSESFISPTGTIFECPSADYQGTGVSSKNGGYGHNYLYLGHFYSIHSVVPSRNRQKYFSITFPSKTFFSGDSQDYNPSYNDYHYGYIFNPTYSYKGILPEHTRHKFGSNYLNADGHVSYHSWPELVQGVDGDNHYYYRLIK